MADARLAHSASCCKSEAHRGLQRQGRTTQWRDIVEQPGREGPMYRMVEARFTEYIMIRIIDGKKFRVLNLFIFDIINGNACYFEGRGSGAGDRSWTQHF